MQTDNVQSDRSMTVIILVVGFCDDDSVSLALSIADSCLFIQCRLCASGNAFS